MGDPLSVQQALNAFGMHTQFHDIDQMMDIPPMSVVMTKEVGIPTFMEETFATISYGIIMCSLLSYYLSVLSTTELPLLWMTLFQQRGLVLLRRLFGSKRNPTSRNPLRFVIYHLSNWASSLQSSPDYAWNSAYIQLLLTIFDEGYGLQVIDGRSMRRLVQNMVLSLICFLHILLLDRSYYNGDGESFSG